MRKGTKGINRSLLGSAIRVAKATHAVALFVFLDPLKEIAAFPKGLRVIFVTRRPRVEIEGLLPPGLTTLIQLPKIEMTRMGQIKTAVVLALSQKLIQQGDKLVFVGGIPEFEMLDSIVCIDTARETELITTHAVDGLAEGVRPEVFQETLSIALELASRGREGKPVGTIFVLGDEEKVLQLSRQMIINPFKGYTDEERNVLSPKLRETLREFSALDGAFVISADGLVLTAGRHLGAASDEETIPRGLGSRHIAAAGITALTGAVAIVISESTGDLRIFKSGKILMEIEKPIQPPVAK